MNWKTFTPEELVIIRKNPYVKSATAHMIRFTVAFKNEFWEQFEKGMSPADIMRTLGFDIYVLGDSRINSIVRHIREQVENGTDFHEVNQTSVLVETTDKPQQPSKVLLHMQHEVAYMKQELEFIKKIILADREARRKCLSKQDLTPNSESSEK